MSAKAASSSDPDLRRRRFLGYFSAAGLGSTLFPGALWAAVQDRSRITEDMIAEAAKIAGLSFDDDEREMMARGVNQSLAGFEELRKVAVSNSVPPAVYFDPVPPGRPRPTGGRGPASARSSATGVKAPDDLEQAAFWPVSRLSELVRTRQVSSVELTEMYLSRLKWFDEKLHCVVSLCEDRAMEQAERADEEIEAGKWRGPLHGIPWGAKDLLHTKGIRTTYGAKCFEQQMVDEDSTVGQRLDEAGAVMIAKLSLGALAMGDVWYGGRTRNPWDLEQGSSGSSAGPAAATAAGLVGFAIGTETLGSIVSPSTRCGVTGLRPTYGRVSRAGAMALSWTMDKIGPMCRSVEDCALVFDAIHGADLRDPSAVDAPFTWNAAKPLDEIRIGYSRPGYAGRRVSAHDRASLAVLEELGGELIPVEMPRLPASAMRSILSAEAATAFDDITRDGRVDQLVSQGSGSWPNSFRTARMIPAVEFLRAQRVRTLLMEEMAAIMDEVDVFITPSYGANVLTITNLSGHPCVCMPNGFSDDGHPSSISFVGGLYGEADLLRVAQAVQDATDFHRRHPELPT